MNVRRSKVHVGQSSINESTQAYEKPNMSLLDAPCIVCNVAGSWKIAWLINELPKIVLKVYM